MRLRPDPSLQLSLGDFHALVDGENLKIPNYLFERLLDCNIHTAEQFVTMCQSAARSLAIVLNWSLEYVGPALQKLTMTLEGHVSSATLHPGPPVAYNENGCTLTDEERKFFNNANKPGNTNKPN